MTEQARTSRVLIGLIVSMTIGAVVLMALENGPVAGGAFSLSVYLDNDSVEKVVTGGVTLNRKAWGASKCTTAVQSVETLASLQFSMVLPAARISTLISWYAIITVARTAR